MTRLYTKYILLKSLRDYRNERKKSAVLGRFIVTRFKVLKKENEITESSFL